jgi:hypothetical protein
MTTACIIAATLILIAGLFAVIVERTGERDDAREEIARRDREDAAHAERDLLSGRVVDLPLPKPTPVERPDLRVIPPQRDATNADDAMWSALYDENGQHRG